MNTHAFRGFGAGTATDTSDANLLAAGTAIQQTANPCELDSTGVNTVVQAFQTAWNNTTDPNLGTAAGGALTVDGKYGPATAAALAAALPTQTVPGACSTYTGGPSGGGGGTVVPTPTPTNITTTTSTGLPSWLKWLLAALVVGGLGVLGWKLFAKPKKHRVQHRHPSGTVVNVNEKKKRGPKKRARRTK